MSIIYQPIIVINYKEGNWESDPTILLDTSGLLSDDLATKYFIEKT